MPADRSTAKPSRSWGYARVSSQDQGDHGTSLEDQQDRFVTTCQRFDYPAPSIRVEVESGAAEKIERREEMQALLNDAKPGDVIFVTRVDRWSRDVVFAVQSVRALVKRGIGWRSIDDGIDATTESGDVALGYLALAADHEHKRIKKRTVGARIRLLEQGWWANGAVPFGYKRGRREERRQLYLDVVEADAELVRLAYRMSLGGKSLDEIREELQMQRPDRTWARSLIRDMLKNRVYLGEVLAGATWVPGKHPPILDLATFVRVQESKHSRWKGGAKANDEARTATWLVRGLTWCGLCGARMRSVYSGAKDYLGCSALCGARYVPVPALDKAVSTLVLDRMGDLRFELSGGVPKTPPKVPDRAAVRQRIEARRSRAVKAYLDEVITAAELAIERSRLDAELAKLETAAAEAVQRAAAQEPGARRALLANVGQLERAWPRAPVAVQREILSRLAVRILVEADEPARVEWRETAVLLLNNKP